MIARDRASCTSITAPEMVAAVGTPMFWKAAHYFGLTVRRAPLREDLQLDVDAYRALIGALRPVLLGSAPSLTSAWSTRSRGARADRRGARHQLPRRQLRVGGYFLPFAEQLGRVHPRFDFSGAGRHDHQCRPAQVRMPKGASCIISRDPDIFRFQPFAFGA
ncbi:MAG: hypothetical protein U0869_04750 [Chloroflexota bacterium]